MPRTTLPPVTEFALDKIPALRPLCALTIEAEEDRSVTLLNALAGERAYVAAAKEAKAFESSKPTGTKASIPARPRRRVAS